MKKSHQPVAIGIVFIIFWTWLSIESDSPLLRTQADQCNLEVKTKNDVESVLSDNISIRFDHVWPILQQMLCPDMVPDAKLGSALFSLAQDELGMFPWEDPGEVKKESEPGGIMFKHMNMQAGGFAYIPSPSLNNVTSTKSRGSPIIYLRIFKSANNQIRGWGHAELKGRKNEGEYIEGEELGKLLQEVRDHITKAGGSKKICIVTAVRDPISHFLSGYNELEFRYHNDAENVMEDIPPLLFTRYQNGTTQRFEQFVADFVSGPTRIGWNYFTHMELSHIFSMSGILQRLKINNAKLTAYLPSIHNLTYDWPKFLGQSCPNSLPKRVVNKPMISTGQHESSKDPYGFYTAGKRVWNEQGYTARALCALHVMDYACYTKLPDGVPPLCKDVFSNQHFVNQIHIASKKQT